MTQSHYDLGEAIELLRRTPDCLDGWLRGLPECWLACDEGPGTWNARGVLGHLIVGEQTDWMPRVRHLLAHGVEVPFAPFDREAQFERPLPPVDALLDEFRSLRLQSLQELAELRLRSEDLDRQGRHPAFGVVTLRQHLSTWVVHDLTHVTQIARVMAKRYASDVGPWRAYLRVARPGT